MPWPVTGSMARHQGEPGDAELLHWIKDRIDSLLGLDPWAIVGLVGVLIVLIPVAPLMFYRVPTAAPLAIAPGAPQR